MSDDMASLFADGIISEDPQKGIDQNVQAPVKMQSRAEETRFDEIDSQPISVTLIKIDSIILSHLRQQLKPQVENGDLSILVPIEYANAERWKQVRKDGVIRDGAGRLQTPLILFRRTAVERSTYTTPINKYLWRSYETGWNRHNVYDKFNMQNGIQPSRERVNVRIPDYVNLQYSFMLWTDYVEQMNDLIEQFNFETDNYWGERGNFKFKVAVDNYDTETDIGAESDRIVKTTFVANVKAYLLPETYIHTDKGTLTTGQKRYTYKKVITMVEVEQTGENDKESSSKSFPPNE